jgi:allantoinase
MVRLEHVRLEPRPGSRLPGSAVRQTWGPFPQLFDPHEIAHHEYGNRVGIFRVLDLLDRYELVASMAIDTELASRAPLLIEQALRRNWEVVAHGANFCEMVSEDMSENDERMLLRSVTAALEQITGRKPRGWVGADYGESSRTVRLLAEEGFEYVCDWVNDEQPYDLDTGGRRLTALPVSIELDDVFTCRLRGIPAHMWRDMVRGAFDQLQADGADNGRLLVLNLHPYEIGQPFRIRFLAEVLEHIAGRDDVWYATAEEVVLWWQQQASPERDGIFN